MNVKKKLKKLIPALIGGVIGGLTGFFGAKYLVSGKIGIIDIAVLMLAMILIYYIHIIIHEGGHLIFGLLSGYQFVSFRIGSLILYKSNGTYKFGKYKLAGTGGQCLMAPPALVDGMIPYRLYNMGGALLNLIASIIAMIILVVFQLRGTLKAICIIWIFVGIFAAATNGIPMSLGDVDNDGKNALNLGKNKKALRAFWLQLKVNQMQTEGLTLQEMPEEWFEMPEETDMCNTMVAVIGVLCCNRMMEEKRYEETSYMIDGLLGGTNGILGLHKMLLRVDQVYCEIMSQRRQDVLDYMKDKELQKFMKAMQNYPSILRTRYAYALCVENDEKKASNIKKQFEKIVKTHPIEAELRTEKVFFEDCENTDLT